MDGSLRKQAGQQASKQASRQPPDRPPNPKEPAKPNQARASKPQSRQTKGTKRPSIKPNPCSPPKQKHTSSRSKIIENGANPSIDNNYLAMQSWRPERVPIRARKAAQVPPSGTHRRGPTVSAAGLSSQSLISRRSRSLVDILSIAMCKCRRPVQMQFLKHINEMLARASITRSGLFTSFCQLAFHALSVRPGCLQACDG